MKLALIIIVNFLLLVANNIMQFTIAQKYYFPDSRETNSYLTFSFLEFCQWIGRSGILNVILVSSILYCVIRRKYICVMNQQAVDLAKAERNTILEKQRISKDLHDDIGSILSSISIMSYAQMKKLQNPLEKEELKTIGEKAREAMQCMSDIVWAIQSEGESLDKMICRFTQFASEACEAANVDFKIYKAVNLEMGQLEIRRRKDLFLMLKEITNNVLKHAHTTKVECHIKLQNSILTIEIFDNGIGFEFEDKIACSGNGLKNILARAKNSNIEINCFTAAGKGCRFFLLLNINS